MAQSRKCPHCSSESFGRDFAPLGGWRCHNRSVALTATRESPQYPWERLPDHNETGLYQHGPEDDAATLHEMVSEQLTQEAIELDPGFGERLHRHQHIDARYNVVQFLALSKHLWPYVKLAMGFANTPPERRAEVRQWLKEAREMRERMIATSKREAARLRTA